MNKSRESLRKPPVRRALAVAILAVAAAAFVIFAGLPFLNRGLTIASIKKMDDYPLYSMTYYGNYNLDYNPLSPRLDSHCTSFLAFNEKGEPLFCRNFDNALEGDPIVMLHTTRVPGKCATIAMCDLGFLGYDASHLPTGSIFKDQSLLSAPRAPLDGMNEYGVAFSILDVPRVEAPIDTAKKNIDQVAMIRLALDHAKTLDEAIGIIQSYNIVFIRSTHFMIADGSGASAVVEFLDKQIIVTKRTDPWQVVTNFIVSGSLHDGDGQDRYQTAEKELRARNGVLSEDDAITLLKEVALRGTHWSAVYNLKTGEVRLAMARNYDQIYTFKLDMRH